MCLLVLRDDLVVWQLKVQWNANVNLVILTVSDLFAIAGHICAAISFSTGVFRPICNHDL